MAVAEARSWIGTPWHHCGRVKGAGADCFGLVRAALMAGGVEVADPGQYSEAADESLLITCLASTVADELSLAAEHAAGDVFLFVRAGPSPMWHHFAVWTGEGSFVHAWSTPSVMAVVETPLDDFWWRATRTVYRPRWPA